MTKNLSTRLNRLENETTQGSGWKIVYATENGYCENNPFLGDPGRLYSQGDIDQADNVLVIEFVKDWRGEP